MKLKKENLGGLTSALIELVIGVLLLINPTGFTAGIIVGLGVLLALWTMRRFVLSYSYAMNANLLRITHAYGRYQRPMAELGWLWR